MAIMAVMAWLHMATNMADIGVYAKNRENVVKAELKNLHRFKSYDQSKNDSDIMAISFVFLPHFCQKWTALEEALPMCPQSSSLFFWNPWNM